MAELPLAIWVLFIAITMPMVDLATISLRSTFLVAAAHEAAHAAARAKTFKVSIDESTPSAESLALDTVTSSLQRFSEVKATSTVTRIVTTNIADGTTARRTAPLTQPADTDSNTYSIEVVVTGQVNPLFTFNNALFGQLPGLTGPITISCAAEQLSEYPQGLNQ
jgi:hypothetical protein